MNCPPKKQTLLKSMFLSFTQNILLLHLQNCVVLVMHTTTQPHTHTATCTYLICILKLKHKAEKRHVFTLGIVGIFICGTLFTNIPWHCNYCAPASNMCMWGSVWVCILALKILFWLLLPLTLLCGTQKYYQSLYADDTQLCLWNQTILEALSLLTSLSYLILPLMFQQQYI